jgi:photosystem II stability/assembly factor-like uncharacterized protein
MDPSSATGSALSKTGIAVVAAVALLLSFQGKPDASGAPGGRWVTHGPPGNVKWLAVAPSDPAILYAGQVGVFRSVDGGRTWGLASGGLHLDTAVEALAVDPTDSDTVYMATLGRRMFKTTDGGESWVQRNEGLTPKTFHTVVVDPVDPDVVYAGGGLGVPGPILYKSTDGADTWVNITDHMGNSIRSIAVDPSDHRIVYVGVYQSRGLFKSTDGGATWVPSARGIPKFATIQALAVDPSNPDVVYAGRGGPESPYLYRSTDAGETWAPVGEGIITDDVWDLAIDPQDPTTVYAATGDGVFRSTDTGEAWIRLDEGPSAATTVEIDPRSPSTLWASMVQGTAGANLGVFKSTDAGATWRQHTEGLSGGTVDAVAFDPTDPDVVYAGFLSQDPRIYKSIDGGLHWTAYRTGTPGPVIYEDLVVDPSRPSIVYAATFFGVFKSTTGGRSFQETGLNDPVEDLAMDPTDPSHLVAASGGVWESTDGAKTWHKTSLPELFVASVAFDPTDPQVLYAGIGGNQFDPGGLYRSNDGGNTWRSILWLNQDDTTVRDIEIHPSDSRTVYLGVGVSPGQQGPGLVLKSTDGGQSWTRARTDFPAWVNDLAIVPAQPSTLYAATYGGAYRSTDAGVHWTPWNDGLASGYVSSIVVTESGSRVYAAVASGGGVYRLDVP